MDRQMDIDTAIDWDTETDRDKDMDTDRTSDTDTERIGTRTLTWTYPDRNVMQMGPITHGIMFRGV